MPGYCPAKNTTWGNTQTHHKSVPGDAAASTAAAPVTLGTRN